MGEEIGITVVGVAVGEGIRVGATVGIKVGSGVAVGEGIRVGPIVGIRVGSGVAVNEWVGVGVSDA